MLKAFGAELQYLLRTEVGLLARLMEDKLSLLPKAACSTGSPNTSPGMPPSSNPAAWCYLYRVASKNVTVCSDPDTPWLTKSGLVYLQLVVQHHQVIFRLPRKETICTEPSKVHTFIYSELRSQHDAGGVVPLAASDCHPSDPAPHRSHAGPAAG